MTIDRHSQLTAEIQERFVDCGYSEFGSLRLRVDGENHVHVTGRLPSYFLRQKAEMLIQSHPHVGEIHSEIVVTHSDLDP